MTSQQAFFMGIDGGGTKCKARLEDAQGNLLAEAVAGPANAARDFQGTIESIYLACDRLIEQAGSPHVKYAQIHAGIGLAGANLPHIKDKLLTHVHPFASLALSTDLHIACLGAHQGQAGAIMITGTGSSGASIINGHCLEVGGHGFVVGDKGSGAWLGRMAVSHSLETLDELLPHCALSQQVLKTLECNSAYELVKKTIDAKPSFFAQLAPVVLQLAAEKQSTAVEFVTEGANYISRVARRLMLLAPARLSIIGGISGLLIPWLDNDVKTLLSEALLPPEAGAILLAKSNLTK